MFLYQRKFTSWHRKLSVSSKHWNLQWGCHILKIWLCCFHKNINICQQLCLVYFWHFWHKQAELQQRRRSFKRWKWSKLDHWWSIFCKQFMPKPKQIQWALLYWWCCQHCIWFSSFCYQFYFWWKCCWDWWGCFSSKLPIKYESANINFQLQWWTQQYRYCLVSLCCSTVQSYNLQLFICKQHRRSFCWKLLWTDIPPHFIITLSIQCWCFSDAELHSSVDELHTLLGQWRFSWHRWITAIWIKGVSNVTREANSNGTNNSHWMGN